MKNKKFRVIVLTHGGAKELLQELSVIYEIDVVGVFLELETEQKRTIIQKLRRSVRYDGLVPSLLKIPGFISGKRGLSKQISERNAVEQSELVLTASRLNIPIFEVQNFHLQEAKDQLKSAHADLGIVYGTNIIRESVFSIPRLGCLNLHQGNAPYYRGGPSVFWELMNDEDKIGITIHFVAPKVDTGDIVRQEFVNLSYDHMQYGHNFEAFLADFRSTLIGTSARLMASAVRDIATNCYQLIPQNTSLGKRYRIPTKKEKDLLRKRLKARSRK